jgi:Cdc6-like AAA superfamily ATPase
LTKIHQWLSPPDPSLNYKKALKQRQADTGLWFVKSKQYSEWKTDSRSFLWLYGIPGCGKTILSSTVLENIFQHRADDLAKAVAYFYFAFNDKQKQASEQMIRSLISQLLRQCSKIPQILETLFSSYENGRQQASSDDLLEVLHQIILGIPQSYVVLDALDECSDRAELMQVIEMIIGWQLDGLHLLVTSRKEQDIQQSLSNLVQDRDMICLQSDLVDLDIRSYVRHRLSIDRDLGKWKDSDIRGHIETTLIKGAHGMYVYPRSIS